MRKVGKVVTMVQRFLGVLVLSALLTGFFSVTSVAEEITPPNSMTKDVEVEVLEAVLVEGADISSEIMAYTMLADCTIGVRGASDGMHIDISTGSVGTASVLGIKDVKIYKKTWYGGWDLVAVCSGSESYNRSNMGISILYENAVKGATYKITCVHYGNVDEYIEGSNDTGAFVFTY